MYPLKITFKSLTNENKFLLSTCYVLVIVLGTGYIVMIKFENFSFSGVQKKVCSMTKDFGKQDAKSIKV